MSRKLHVEFAATKYDEFVQPTGFLTHHPACHALFYYYLVATRVRDSDKFDPVVEGNQNVPPNYKQLFRSISIMYGVKPEEMLQHWSNVDMQAAVMGWPKLEDTEKRFDRVPEIRGETKQ